MRDLFDRLRWHLRLGRPGPVEAAAVAIAARELDEADVVLDTWRQARDRTATDAEARERYVRLRVAALRRELREGSGPLLAADLADRQAAQAEVLNRVEAWRQSPEGQRAYHEALDAALAGWLPLTLLYFGAILAIFAITLWLAT